MIPMGDGGFVFFWVSQTRAQCQRRCVHHTRAQSQPHDHYGDGVDAADYR